MQIFTRYLYHPIETYVFRNITTSPNCEQIFIEGSQVSYFFFIENNCEYPFLLGNLSYDNEKPFFVLLLQKLQFLHINSSTNNCLLNIETNVLPNQIFLGLFLRIEHITLYPNVLSAFTFYLYNFTLQLTNTQICHCRPN